LPPRGAAVRGFVKPRRESQRFSAANFPRGNSRRQRAAKRNLRVLGSITMSAPPVFSSLLENFSKFPAASERNMPLSTFRPADCPCTETKTRSGIPSIDTDRFRNLLCIAAIHDDSTSYLASIDYKHRLDRQVRPLQPSPLPHKDVGIGCAPPARRQSRKFSSSKIGNHVLPKSWSSTRRRLTAAMVKHWLLRNAADGHGASPRKDRATCHRISG